ncbi:MAG: hypothetical protein IJO49_06710, partial [Clostridia bacterium]|nr:hypothetical protein [Clostridia bacterium]
MSAKKYLPFLAVIELATRVLSYRSNLKKSIKKLVYTARVKRLMLTSVAIFVLLLLMIAFNFSKILTIICEIVLLLLVHFPELLVFVSNFINKPIETSINNYYISDAKKILSQHKNLTTIGVTGSYGKTSVKFILNRILSEEFNTTATPESFNTPMGIVRTVRERMKTQTEVFIAEMCAKNQGDIKELCEL